MAGIRYERKAQAYLQELYPDTYVASPWLMFRMAYEPLLRWCQPDGLLFDIERGEITIVEIKLRHMKEAYTQITGIYHPVLRSIFPIPWTFRHLEVTRFYDPAVPFPARIQLVSDPMLTPKSVFGVHIYR